MFARCRNSLAAGLAFGLAGCTDKDITSYRVPKDAAVAAAAPAPAPAAAPSAPATMDLRWAAPAGWQAQPASGLRIASFAAPGPDGTSADVSVVTFGGAGGDVLANINRWRGQLKLEPVTAAQLPALIEALATPAGSFSIADILGGSAGGAPATRILGAWLEVSGRVWFFKMMGPQPAVAAQRDAFFGLLRSVHPEAGVPAPAAAATTPFVVAGADQSDNASLRWQAPAAWRAKPVSAMRKGSYGVGPEATPADLSVTAFPGDVGGLAANVNRWRGQVGLPELEPSAVPGATETLTAHGLTFTLVDCAGTADAGGQRILAALVSWQGATWFFKLTGPDTVVEGARPAFLSFLQTVQAP